MTPLTAEWVTAAEDDWRTMLREIRVRKNPSFRSVCFHAQQCAEKYVKALLQEAHAAIPKTHDLERLMRLVAGHYSAILLLQSDLKALTQYAVNIRYPGYLADKLLATDARKQCERVREFARVSLLLPATLPPGSRKARQRIISKKLKKRRRK